MFSNSELAMTNQPESVSQLLRRLRPADQTVSPEESVADAAGGLWIRCFDRLIREAKKHLRANSRRMMDEEDVAIIAFDAFLTGVAQGRFSRLSTREDLWQIMAMLVQRKAMSMLRCHTAQKRGGGDVRGDSGFVRGEMEGGIENVSDPWIAEQMCVETRDLFDKLRTPELKSIALMKMEGYTNPEIAGSMSIAVRSVERKLHRIRDTLAREFPTR
ncbi:MAG: ECF-type sigma factor [Planctomycetota bacterium]